MGQDGVEVEVNVLDVHMNAADAFAAGKWEALFTPDTVLIFVTPPTIQELKDRLVGRGTETQEVIESRLKRASEEAEGIESYDYLLVNDVVEDCVDELHEIILSEHRRASRNEEFIRTIQKESREFFN